MIAFLPAIPWLAEPAVKYGGSALLIVLALSGTYIKGRTDGRILAEASIAEQKLEWQSKVIEIDRDNKRQVDLIAFNYRKTVETLEDQIEKLKNKKPEVITKTVKVYIPREVDYPIPEGFISLHNSAALGTILDEEISTASNISDKRLSDAGAVVATNYYQCNVIRERLIALQHIVKTFQDKQQELIK